MWIWTHGPGFASHLFNWVPYCPKSPKGPEESKFTRKVANRYAPGFLNLDSLIFMRTPDSHRMRTYNMDPLLRILEPQTNACVKGFFIKAWYGKYHIQNFRWSIWLIDYGSLYSLEWEAIAMLLCNYTTYLQKSTYNFLNFTFYISEQRIWWPFLGPKVWALWKALMAVPGLWLILVSIALTVPCS